MFKKKLLLIFFLLLACFGSNSQSIKQLEDSTYIFWQPGISIGYKDYKGPSFPNGLIVVPEIAIWSALDLPENVEYKLDRIRFHIAPVFDKYLSHADTNDKQLIGVGSVHFNIAEICARKARTMLVAALDTVSSYTSASSVFKSVIIQMHEERLRMNRKFYWEYFKNKNTQSLIVWTNQLNEELKNTSGSATRVIDHLRFIKMSPLEKGYKEDLSCNPTVIKDKYEQTLTPCTWHAGFNQVSRFSMEKVRN